MSGSRTRLCFELWMNVMEEGLGRTPTAVSSGLTFLLVRMSSQDVCYGKGSAQNFHSLEVLLFFFFYSQQLAEKYIFPCLKPAKWVIFLPASDVYVRSFFLSLLLNNISNLSTPNFCVFVKCLAKNCRLCKSEIIRGWVFP